ncbi:hypothetical protein HK098_004595 [Nowakowskiella sp. JEL0407]|nr:hypothetical protein HK098_004595 [Nowakowskiella sp. JEL0407]
MKNSFFTTLLSLCALAHCISAIFVNNKPPYVSFSRVNGDDTISIYSRQGVADIVVDAEDWPGVLRAANDLKTDLGRVVEDDAFRVLTTKNGTLSNVGTPAIIIGTLGKSKIIDSLMKQNKLNVTNLSGKWESFQAQIVTDVTVGTSLVYHALVIVGSDKRGSIYGIYDLSEQAGVSPWYWWADVPSIKRSVIYARLTKPYSQGEPTVKYRGVFLNDEQPALTNWAVEKFGPVFNSAFYVRVFELLLRLKANYLWPAMWNSMFAVDDPANQRLADEYGIVMATSHQEPMMRATKEWQTMGNGKWNYTTNSEFLKNFWDQSIARAAPYESYITLGMRGDGDLPYSEELAVSIQQQIIADQRQIISKYHNGTLSGTGQVWALYKEVQGYYERGMRVPDDVTLLWVDDNWGNIRRLPTDDEIGRSGGAGIYYHFDYVGDPRSYKWINTNHIPKIYEQLSLANVRGATKIFIVNVGDLKPMEIPIDFFMDYAWDATKWNHNNLGLYLESWSAREFGNIDHTEVAALVDGYTKINARRKPELLDVNTYSLLYFKEAERVIAEWDDLETRALKVYGTVSASAKAAFFQLVLYPIQASANLNKIYINAARSNLYSTQVRNSANDYADAAEKYFATDAALTKQYHSLLGGKWNHMMDQTHINYQFWQQPLKNSLPAVNRVQQTEMGLPGPLGIGIEGSQGAWPGDNRFQCSQGYNCPPPTLPKLERYGVQTKWIDVFNRGTSDITFTATPSASWLKVSPASGTLMKGKQEQRLTVSVSWAEIPAGTTSGTIVVNSTAALTTAVTITVPINNQAAPSGFTGFVEADGYVSIEAEHFSRNIPVDGVKWEILPKYGKTLSALTPFPRNAKSFIGASTSPVLEYDVYLYSTPTNGKLSITSYLAPSLNQHPTRPLKFAISVDDGAKQEFQPVPNANPGSLPKMWNDMVGNSINLIQSSHDVSTAGKHTVKFWMLEPNIVLEKLVLNITNTVPNVYLGPPESTRI